MADPEPKIRLLADYSRLDQRSGRRYSSFELRQIARRCYIVIAKSTSRHDAQSWCRRLTCKDIGLFGPDMRKGTLMRDKPPSQQLFPSPLCSRNCS